MRADVKPNLVVTHPSREENDTQTASRNFARNRQQTAFWELE
jgi:hypothetical protein